MKSVVCSLHFYLQFTFYPGLQCAVCSLRFTLTIYNLIFNKVEAKSERFCTSLKYTSHQVILHLTVISVARPFIK